MENVGVRIADDLLDGIPAIAEFIGLEERQAYHLATTKRIPVFRLGRKVCAMKSSLRAHFDALQKQAGAA